MINTDIKNVKTIELKEDGFGMKAGSVFERENDLFVNNSVVEINREGLSYTRKETHKYNASVIADNAELFNVVEYTDEYLKEQAEIQKAKSPFKPRKDVRKKIAEYETAIEEMENGMHVSYEDLTQDERDEAITVWTNLVKVLKWVINEDKQVC